MTWAEAVAGFSKDARAVARRLVSELSEGTYGRTREQLAHYCGSTYTTPMPAERLDAALSEIDAAGHLWSDQAGYRWRTEPLRSQSRSQADGTSVSIG